HGAGGTASGGAGSSGAASAGTAADGADNGGAASANGASGPKLTGAQARATKKELASIERRMDKLNSQIADKHKEMAAHDQTDFEGLAERQMRWPGATEALEA